MQPPSSVADSKRFIWITSHTKKKKQEMQRRDSRRWCIEHNEEAVDSVKGIPLYILLYLLGMTYSGSVNAHAMCT
jgi:hypothetical protein